MALFHVNASKLRDIIPEISVGDEVYISGTIYTARDAAHKRIVSLLQEGKPLPFNLNGACIYYAGPTPEPPGRPIGSCGPTTSGRMDACRKCIKYSSMRANILKEFGPYRRTIQEKEAQRSAAHEL